VISPPLQQPLWPDRGRFETVVHGLAGLPPLVLAAECDHLKERLASVARGEAFLLQGGDCAETFAGIWTMPALKIRIWPVLRVLRGFLGLLLTVVT